jgi:chemotaxis protein CheX
MITEEEIATIAQTVLGTMLHIEAVPEEQSSDCVDTEPYFTGCVQLSGAWQGALLVQGAAYLERVLAAVFFELEEPEVTESDVRDAIAEITNMIGGNIKGQVPSPSFLSIPSVTIGNDFNFYLAGVSIISQVVMNCQGAPLRIVLCQRTDSPENAV